MSNSIFDYTLPALTGFIVTYYIISSGGTFMEALFYGLLTVGLTLIGTFIIRVYLEPKLEDRREDIKKHKRKLVEKILHRLRDANIYYKDFKILITDIEDLRKQDLFDLSFKHLKAYPNILDNWNKSEEKIKCLNKELEDLKKYILRKIGNRFDVQYMKYLLSHIWLIIRSDIKGNIENLDNLKIDIKKELKYCYVQLENDIGIHCKEYSNKKVKQAIEDLIKDDKFRKQLSEITEENKILREIYDGELKGYLKELLDKLENGYNLKGKCKECSFWGDC